MTLAQYAGAVTEILDAQGIPDYPATFDTDVEACWQLRLTPVEAAAKLTTEYGGESSEEE